MEWRTPVYWGWFLQFSRSEGHKTKETYPTRPGSPTPCKQGLKRKKEKRKNKKCKEGRGKKPKIQACLNSQEIRKVNKVKKQNKTKETETSKKKLYVSQ